MDRNPISDLEAVAAMPGLEQLGEVLAAHVPSKRGTATDPRSLLVFLAGRAAFGSANACESLLMTTDVWSTLRASAARVGRDLPTAPPTFNKLHHTRREAAAGMAEAVAAELPAVAVPLAQSIGLLDSQRSSPWHAPAPGRVIYGDGSVFRPLSDVRVDDDGVVLGSRAKVAPRFSPQFEGKDGKNAGTGLPISVVGCHGRSRWQRVVLGVDLYPDGNEKECSLRQFETIIDLAGGGVSHVVYDRLLTGTHVRRLMRTGVVPVVAMKSAMTTQRHVVLPSELRRAGYATTGSRGKTKGKGPRQRSGTKDPKSRLQVHPLQLVEHPVGSGVCLHELWAVDGAVVDVAPGEPVTLDSTYVDCVDLRWEAHDDGLHPIGRYLVPCTHGSVRVDIDLASARSTKKNADGELLALADWVRPIPESADAFARTEGLRSDAESVFSWMKALLPRERASSLNPSHFLLDVVGAALLCNATAWDVHGAQHTECAKHEARLASRRHVQAKREPCL